MKHSVFYVHLALFSHFHIETVVEVPLLFPPPHLALPQSWLLIYLTQKSRPRITKWDRLMRTARDQVKLFLRKYIVFL